MEAVTGEGVKVLDKANKAKVLELELTTDFEPFTHQQEALDAWQEAGGRGVVVLPTGAGKTFVAHLAIQSVNQSALIVVPTLDLMQQWYAGLEKAFPGADLGLLGGGSKDDAALLVATYDSAAIFAEKLGNRFGLLVFDEVHHLPGDFTRTVAEYSLAPYRLGLSATVERSDGKHADIFELVGQAVYRKTPEQLAGGALAEYRTERIKVRLSDEERRAYDEAVAQRNAFLSENRIFLGTLQGWQRFVRASAQSSAGRAAMLAHRRARALAFGTDAKLRVLADLLTKHAGDRVLIFTDDNRTVYRVSEVFLIPAITHQTKVKERHAALTRFRAGEYPRLVTSRVLNEGVDVPAANVAIVLSGTGSTREHVQRLGRILRPAAGKQAVLYEVVAEDTSEETVSKRRRGELKSDPKPTEAPAEASSGLKPISAQESLSFDEL